ncbi:hypothetical protein AB0D68_34590 [Streptomyces sp. NPDC048212]|uniref:hypothetical protein n=1 Tax=Streptomyces sp. NPDC048212 TaxID=3156658 RepID=UPI0033CAF4AC
MMDIDRTAPLVVELHRTVHAPLETIWRLHTETDSWPAWNDGIDTAVPHGPLAPGASSTGRQPASTSTPPSPR